MAKRKASAQKPAPKAPSKKIAEKKASRGKAISKNAVRYSPEEKTEIINFVRDHDKAHGKGGQAAAARMFGVSALSISSWMKTPAMPLPKKKALAKETPAEAPSSETSKEKAPRKKDSTKQGVRYSPEQKAEILTFVRDYDATQGKGGQTVASKRFGVSTISIWMWMKASAKPKEKTVAKKAAPPESRNSNENEMIGKVQALRRMVEIQEEIEGLKAQFEDLKRAI